MLDEALHAAGGKCTIVSPSDNSTVVLPEDLCGHIREPSTCLEAFPDTCMQAIPTMMSRTLISAMMEAKGCPCR